MQISMLLSPITLAHIPPLLAEIDIALGTHSLPRRIVSRIAATLAFVDGDDIALSQHPDHHRQAVALLERFGLGVLDRTPEQGVTWDGQCVAIGMEPSVIIHEVAHFQLAPPSRRHLVDFGLGAGPESGDKASGEADRRLFGVDCDREEARTSLLGILWETELQQPAILAFVEQNWLEGGATQKNLDHLLAVVDDLFRGGFIDEDGRPTEKLAE
jgi:hypothetical protein